MKAADRSRFDKRSTRARANGTYTIAGQPTRDYIATDGGLYLVEDGKVLFFGITFSIQNNNQDLRLSLSFKIPRLIATGKFHSFPKGYLIGSKIFEPLTGHPSQVAINGKLKCLERDDHGVVAEACCTFPESEGYPAIESHVAYIGATADLECLPLHAIHRHAAAWVPSTVAEYSFGCSRGGWVCSPPRPLPQITHR